MCVSIRADVTENTSFSDISITIVGVLLLLGPHRSPGSDRLLSLQADQRLTQCARSAETRCENWAGHRLVVHLLGPWISGCLSA